MYPIGFISNSQLAHNGTNGGALGSPNAPTNIVTTAVSDTEITIGWDAPVEDVSHSAATSYLVYLDGVLVTYNLNTLSYTFSDLTPDTGYTIGVSASNAYGEGQVTNTGLGTLRVAPVYDGYTTDLEKVTLTWHRPDIEIPSNIYYKQVDTDSYVLLNDGTNVSSPAQVTLPMQGTSYYIKIIAVDEFEMPLEIQVTTGQLNGPPAFNISILAVYDTSILFSFNNPQTGGADYTAVLRSNSLDNLATYTYTVGGGTTDTETISGLSASTTYYLSLSTTDGTIITYASVNDVPTENIQFNTQIAAGTLLGSDCVNGNIVDTYADGNGGGSGVISSYNSSTCYPATVYIEADTSIGVGQLTFKLHNPYYNLGVSGYFVVDIAVIDPNSNNTVGTHQEYVVMEGEESQQFSVSSYSGTYKLYPSVTNSTGTTPGVAWNTGGNYVYCASLEYTYVAGTVTVNSSTSASFSVASANGVYDVHYWKTATESYETSLILNYTGGTINIDGLSPSTDYTFLAINNTNPLEIVVINNSGSGDGSVGVTMCSASGDYLASECQGSDYYNTYADGSCGTYSSLNEADYDFCPLKDFYITTATGSTNMFYYQFSNPSTKAMTFIVELAQDVDFTTPIPGAEGVTIYTIEVMAGQISSGSIQIDTTLTTGTNLFMRASYANSAGRNYSIDGVNSTGERFVVFSYSE